MLKFYTFTTMRYIASITLLFIFCLSASAQLKTPNPSKVMMMNGRIYNVQLTHLDPVLVQFKYKKKKIITANRDKVFSITDSTGKKTYIYQQDDINNVGVVDMERYLIGYNDARRYRYGGDFAIGFGSGVGGSFLGVLWGFSVPIGFSLGNSLLPAKPTKRIAALHPDLVYDEYYRLGVRKKIKQRRFLGTLLGGAAGMATGVVILQFIVRPLTGINAFF